MSKQTYEPWSEVFDIFARYAPGAPADVAGHDGKIWAGPNPEKVPQETRDYLKTLGWQADTFHECFFRFL